MKSGPRFVSLYASLLVFLAVSCTTHQRPATSSDEPAANRGGNSGAAAVQQAPGSVDRELLVERERSATAQTLAKEVAGGVPVEFSAVNMVETDPVSTLPDAAKMLPQGAASRSTN